MGSAPLGLITALQDRYRLDRELGAGGMATVYLAHDLRNNRKVALKVLRPELAAILGAERFLKEIDTTANLQHPHILPLFDSGEAGSFLYYVMPFVEGESLRDRLTREKQLPIADAVRIATEVAEALEYAHQLGVIHRDIKPENILLSRGHALVADFGIALAVVEAGGGRLTETGLSLGTPAYMSPEQALAETDLDGRTDQYSLACVLYEMVAGEPPYTGPTAQAIIAKRLREPVPHLSTVRDVPAAVEQAVTRALAKAKADRFATLGDFSRGLAAPQTRWETPWWRHRWPQLGVLFGTLTIAAYLAVRITSSPDEPSTSVRPFTFSGRAGAPAISPDGRMVAYVVGNKALVLQAVTGGEPLVLVPTSRLLFAPRWTRDGSAILFVMMRDSMHLAGTWMVPASGGTPRQVTDDMDTFDAGLDSTTAVQFSYDTHAARFIALGTGKTTREVTVPDSVGYSNSFAWSRDGRLLALISDKEQVWVLNLVDSTFHRVGNGNNAVRWGHGDDRLFYLRRVQGVAWLMRSDIDLNSGKPRGASRALLSVPHAVAFDVSPSGTVVLSEEVTASQAHALTLAPGVPSRVVEDRALTEGSADVSWVSISPDGQSVAYVRNAGGRSAVELAPFSGGSARVVGQTGADQLSPTFAPDGRTLSLIQKDSTRASLALVDLAGGTFRRVGDHVPTSWAGWSADDRHLVYATDNGREVAVTDLASQTESVVRVPDSLGKVYNGQMPSPGGGQLLISTLRRQTNWGELWLVDRATSKWSRVAEPFGESYPIKWLSDGTVYVANHRALVGEWGTVRIEIWRLKLAQGKFDFVASLPDGCFWPAISDDGRRAACVYTKSQSDLLIVSGADSRGR